LGPIEYVLPEDGDRIQSPKGRILNKRQDDDNLQNCDSYINQPSSVIEMLRDFREARKLILKFYVNDFRDSIMQLTIS
jgi:hypothetical protein